MNDRKWSDSPALVTPGDLRVYPTPDQPARLTPDYSVDRELHRLFTIGAAAQWRADDPMFLWDRPVNFAAQVVPDMYSMFWGTRWWDEFTGHMGLEEFRRFTLAETISQFLHGEQIALKVAGQLAASEPGLDSAFACAQQCNDEARHAEFFRRYVARLGLSMPIGAGLEELGREAIVDSRTYHKCIALQLVIEGLALASFKTIQKGLAVTGEMGGGDKILKVGLSYVRRDESRHVGLGVHIIRRHLSRLPDADREECADFVFEAFRLMRQRLMLNNVCEANGVDPEVVFADAIANGGMVSFHKSLNKGVLPQAVLLGLVPDRLREPYAKEYGADWSIIGQRAKDMEETDL